MTEIKIAGHCLDWVDHFLWIASAIICVAALLGAAQAAAEIYVKLQAAKAALAPKDPKTTTGEDGGSTPIIGALKGLVEAMASAPSWIALFIAGIALMWITSSQLPSICRPEEEKPVVVVPVGKADNAAEAPGNVAEPAGNAVANIASNSAGNE